MVIGSICRDFFMICGGERRLAGRQERDVFLGVRNTTCLVEQQRRTAVGRSKVRA
jgi:hypothetical protein